MLQALQRFNGEYTFKVDVVDIDVDDVLLAKYDELVPVLVVRKGVDEVLEICHYFLDEAKVVAFLKTT